MSNATKWPRPAALASLFLAWGLVGCDAVSNHPAVPPEAAQVMRESKHVFADLRGDVLQFVGGFQLAPAETAAASQFMRAMLSVFEAESAGDIVRAGIEVKRAQACMLLVGIDSSRIIPDIKRYMLADEGRRKTWNDFQAWLDESELPDFSGAACLPLAP